MLKALSPKRVVINSEHHVTFEKNKYKHMKTIRLILLFLMTIFLSIKSHSQIKHTENTLKLISTKNQQKTTIDSIKWLTGSWIGNGFGAECEEVWSLPKANTMMGMFQMFKDGKILIYEFIQIVEENRSLVLKLKHFNANFSGWEEKDKTVDFPLIRIEGTTAWFDGLTYKRQGNELKSWVAIKQKDGTLEEGELTFKLNTYKK